MPPAHPPTPIIPPGFTTVLIGGMPAARVGDQNRLRRDHPASRGTHRPDRRLTT